MNKPVSHYNFFYRNGLSLVMVTLALFSFGGMALSGWLEYKQFLTDHRLPVVGFFSYLHNGHLIQATFENWESEFLQMGLYVVFTIFLRQWGSSESKALDKEEESDREPEPRPNAPWPVKRGGWVLKLYENSLSIALFILFALSFLMHWYGSWRDYNLNQLADGKPAVNYFAYLGSQRFWFESFQNWQSEFLSVFVLVWLSIYLRQKGSSQSKAVDDSYEKTGH